MQLAMPRQFLRFDGQRDLEIRYAKAPRSLGIHTDVRHLELEADSP